MAYLSEIKTSLFSVYDVSKDFVKVSMQSSAKPNSIYQHNYTSKRYSQEASRINFNLNHYVCIENIGQKSQCLFSQRELKNFIKFCRNAYTDNRNSGETTYQFVPELTEYYPVLVLVFEEIGVQLWSRKEETLLITRLLQRDFIEMMSVLGDMLDNFLVLSSNNTVIYSAESLAFSRGNLHSDNPNNDTPFGETHTIPDTIKQVSEILNTGVELNSAPPVNGGQTFMSTTTEEVEDTSVSNEFVPEIQPESDDESNALGLDLDSANDNPEDIPAFLR